MAVSYVNCMFIVCAWFRDV